ncbi:MAG: RnfABCDGE type electron transport complex subunit B [Clostridia bacterium]|nr:RnfABCDGE type electron transport complex subunit B [Clostridia bacterium]
MDILLPVIIVAVIGLIAGVGLALASKFMAVPVDEKQEKLRACLPGANCGACGFSGCDGYAEALAKGEAEPNKCAPGGSTTAEQLAEILGVSVTESEPMIAFIACNGRPDNAVEKYTYTGMESCTAASILHGGPLTCQFGCIGFGDCAKACPFGAITVENGRPVVCKDLCMACGACVKACPKALISLVPKNAPIKVACSNKQKGAAVVKACKASCIACGMCERTCPNGAIKVVDNCAVIDYSICTGCGQCKDACKRGALI